MNPNFIVPPGTILKEYMDTRGITQKELAQLTDSSERHVSELIHAKIKLTEAFAVKLERVFPDVKAEFWMNLETAYRLHLLRNQDHNIPELKQVAKDFQFKSVFKGMTLTLQEQAHRMLDLLEIDSFDQAEDQMNDLSLNFMEDGGDKKSMYVWIKLCESEIDIQNDVENIPTFSIDRLKANVNVFKRLIYTQDFDVALTNLTRFAHAMGILIVMHESIPNAKIRGAVRFLDDNPIIYLSDRYKRLDTFYFAFIHELAHIMNSDVSKGNQAIVITNETEQLANDYAKDFLINRHTYETFVDSHQNIKEEDILVFAKNHRIVPDILIGFLEHDHIIEYGSFSYLRSKYRR